MTAPWLGEMPAEQRAQVVTRSVWAPLSLDGMTAAIRDAEIHARRKALEEAAAFLTEYAEAVGDAALPVSACAAAIRNMP